MDPWEDIECFENTSLILENLKLNINTQNNEKLEAKQKTKPKYEIQPRDYVTFNYLSTCDPKNPSSKGKDSNTLFKIIERSQKMKEKRNYLQRDRSLERIERNKLKIAEEKRKCEEERRKHEEKLVTLKENYKFKRLKEEERRRNEKRYLKQLANASQHYDMAIIKRYFGKLRQATFQRKEMEMRAELHWKNSLLKKSFTKLQMNKNETVQRKQELALRFYNNNLIRRCFQLLMENQRFGREKLEQAEKMYSDRIIKTSFSQWRRMIEDEQINYHHQKDKAQSYYNRCLLRRSFARLRQWLSYCQETRFQRSTEFRLRSIVKSILPDFTPPSSSDDDDNDVDMGLDDINRSLRLTNSVWEARVSTFLQN